MFNPIVTFLAIGAGKSLATQANNADSDDDRCERCNGRGCNIFGFNCPDCEGTGLAKKDEYEE